MALDLAEHRNRSDRLAAARRLLGVAAAGSLLAAGMLIFHAVYFAGKPSEPPRAVLAALDGSTLALVPSGRPERVPATLPPGVDLRYDPELGFAPPDPARLLLKGGRP